MSKIKVQVPFVQSHYAQRFIGAIVIHPLFREVKGSAKMSKDFVVTVKFETMFIAQAVEMHRGIAQALAVAAGF